MTSVSSEESSRISLSAKAGGTIPLKSFRFRQAMVRFRFSTVLRWMRYMLKQMPILINVQAKLENKSPCTKLTTPTAMHTTRARMWVRRQYEKVFIGYSFNLSIFR